VITAWNTFVRAHFGLTLAKRPKKDQEKTKKTKKENRNSTWNCVRETIPYYWHTIISCPHAIVDVISNFM